MKICKNDSEIILYPVTECSKCVIKTQTGCKWLKIIGIYNLSDCGGIRLNILSDIFIMKIYFRNRAAKLKHLNGGIHVIDVHFMMRFVQFFHQQF